MIQELDLKQGEGRQASRARARRHLRHIWSGTISPTIEHMRGERERERERENQRRGFRRGMLTRTGTGTVASAMAERCPFKCLCLMHPHSRSVAFSASVLVKYDGR